MSTKIKGITIELGADTSGLDSALKNANKTLASTQNQLNQVNKALKLDPGNTDLIEQKQRKLASAIEATTAKLKALKQAQSQIGQSGGSQDQYDALTLEISETQSRLNKLNQEQASFSMQAQSAQGSTNALAQGLSKVGGVASQVAAQTAALSAAAAAALGGMVALAVKASQTADNWLTLSQQTGLATSTIQKFAYAAEQIDVPLPTITSAITNMKKHLDDTSGIWDRIGVKVQNQNGSYRAIEDIFFDCVRALGNIHDETARDTAAMQIFGKSANELAGLLDDGGKKMQALGKEAEQSGMIIPEEDLQKLGEFNDLIEEMKTKLSFAGMQAALPILEALSPVIDLVAESMSIFASVLSALPTPIVAIVAGLALLIAVIAPIAMGIAAVCNALSTLAAVAPVVGQAIVTMATQMTTALAANPYITAIVAIIAILAALAFAIYEVATHWDEIKEGASVAFGGAVSAAQNFASGVKSAFNAVQNAVSNLPDLGSKFGSMFGGALSAVTQVISKIMAKFNELKEKARNAGAGVLNSFTEGIQSVISKVTQAFQRLASAVKQVFSGMENDARSSGSRVGTAFTDSYNNSINNIRRPTVSNPVGGTYFGTPGGFTNTNGPTGSGASYAPMGASNTNVTVELVGSAKNIFDTVRVQNNILATATGYHALA